MKDELKITIRIADIAPLSLSIKRDQEEMIRNAEYNVNELWRSWSGRFKGKTSHEILGMVAYQFARLYFETKAQADILDNTLESFEDELDKILLKVD